MTRCRLFNAIVFLAVLLMVPVVSAGDCSYGSVHARFQDPKGCWMDATVHPVLKPGDVFHVQVSVICSQSCQVFFVKLHEYGTPVYEVLAGPTQMEEILEVRGTIDVQSPYLYEWTIRVRPDTSWTSASAPLEVFTQLNKDDSEDCVIDFDVIVATILPENQTGPLVHHVEGDRTQNVHPGGSTPGFQGGLLLVSIAVLSMLINIKRLR